MVLYKLTTQDGRTRVGYPNETRWGEDVEHEATGPEGGGLCSASWVHAYVDPRLAVIFNSIHASIDDPVLWEARGVVGKSDGTKVGCRRLTTTRKIDMPVVTTEQRVRFAILCAKRVCENARWNAWAYKWLSGEAGVRETEEATEISEVAEVVAEAAASATAAAWAAEAARTAEARAAAWAAAWAAEVATRAADIDLVEIARQATSVGK